MTWAYFSVSATWSCRRPARDSVSASVPSTSRLLERDGTVEVVAVPRHRREVVPAVEQHSGELASTVRPEIEEDRRVLGLEPRMLRDHDRLQKLVSDTAGITTPNRADRICRHFAGAAGDCAEGALDSLPALVAIHRVVAADDRRQAVERKLCEVGGRARRRDVAAVGERVQPRLVRCEAEERAHVVDVRVDAAVRDEPEQVHAAAALEGRAQRGVLEERAVGDRAVDAHQVLVEPAPCADRQVPDLRVAHLPRRQARCLAGRIEGRVREVAPEAVEDRCVRQLDGVAGTGRRAAPPVEDDERYERVAARQIARKESTSSDAPPTSAPSTSG